jgi:hypothetical protein
MLSIDHREEYLMTYSSGTAPFQCLFQTVFNLPDVVTGIYSGGHRLNKDGTVLAM